MTNGGWLHTRLPEDLVTWCESAGLEELGQPCYLDRVPHPLVMHGWSGAGGSLMLFSPELGLSFVYAMNSMVEMQAYPRTPRRLLAEVLNSMT